MFLHAAVITTELALRFGPETFADQEWVETAHTLALPDLGKELMPGIPG